jgi:hypothetical protein
VTVNGTAQKKLGGMITYRDAGAVLVLWLAIISICLMLVSIRRASPGRYAAIGLDRTTENAIVLDTATGTVYLTRPEGTPRIGLNPDAKPVAKSYLDDLVRR